ncbi:MAG: hypothetical protein ACN4E2_03375 [Nitrospinota bacterium]
MRTIGMLAILVMGVILAVKLTRIINWYTFGANQERKKLRLKDRFKINKNGSNQKSD